MSPPKSSEINSPEINSAPAPVQTKKRLLVTVAGGGPAGLAFALKIQALMPGRVTVEMFDRRWEKNRGKTSWISRRGENERRQQVVTIQSQQYLKFPQYVQDALFSEGSFTEMWPQVGSEPARPRNLRIAHIEDELLKLADDHPDIILRAERFDPSTNNVRDQHVLVIAEGSQSSTREHFSDKFGRADDLAFSLDGAQVQDTVLGLLVKSNMPDSSAVVTTVSQNRFLLNTLNGEGFLNMRLTPDEVTEVKGYNPATNQFEDCIQSNPCMMLRHKDGFCCPTHGSFFKPALDGSHKDQARRTSPLWPRIVDGLKLFDIPESNLLGITAFRLSMVQRPRFTAELFPPKRNTPGTFGCLIGDAANAMHFWPGRGLNSGFASAFSLAHCLAAQWRGSLRDADFMLHEAVMSMIQYRNKSRAWRAMTSVDEAGNTRSIQALVGDVYALPPKPSHRDELDAEFTSILQAQRDRMAGRLYKSPSDSDLSKISSRIQPFTRKALIASGPWNTGRMGGEEVDLNLLFRIEEQKATGVPQQSSPPAEEIPKSRRWPTFFFGLASALFIEAFWPGSLHGLYQKIASLFP